MTHLGFLMRQAGVIRRAYERGEITEAERIRWMDDLHKPRGFWAWLMG